MKRAVVLIVALAVSPWAVDTARAQRPEVRAERDVVYGKGGRADLKLNLATPEGKGPFPAVVCVHGGGWYQGRREDMGFMAELLARRGYAAVTVSYRLSAEARFPAQVEDCKAAVRWLRANAARYRVSPDRIGAVGPSAGGHLACLLGVTGRKDGLEGSGGNPDRSSRVQAVVSFFGRTDFTKKTWSNEIEDQGLRPADRRFVRRQAGALQADLPDLLRLARLAAVPAHTRGRGQAGPAA